MAPVVAAFRRRIAGNNAKRKLKLAAAARD